MSQKHTEQHEEQRPHPAPKHAEEKRHDGKSQSKTHHEMRTDTLSAQDRKYLEQHGHDLSKSTLRAKWISSPDQHADHDGQTLATRSHAVIQRWAQERKAVPSTVPGTEHGKELGVLRFNFPGYGGQKLQEVSWDQWFKTFDGRDLVFLFQEKLRNGNQSNFFHLDNPNRSHD